MQKTSNIYYDENCICVTTLLKVAAKNEVVDGDDNSGRKDKRTFFKHMLS